MPIGGDIPWMQDRHWTDQTVSRDLQTGFQMAQQLQQNRARNEHMRQQMAATMLWRTSQLKQAELKEQMTRDELNDSALISEWLKNPRNPPPDGVRTPKGIQLLTQAQRAWAKTTIDSKAAAIEKSYASKIEDLDAVGTLKIQQLLNVNQGEITPEIAAVIDAETARMAGTAADIQVLDEMGEPFVKGGENKPAFLRSLKTGALHKLPQDWSETNPVVPLEIDGKVIGYGIRNASGGITQLREQKSNEPVLSPAQRGTMNAEFGVVKQWWEDLDVKERKKPEVQAEMKRRLKDVENRFSTTKRVRVKSPSGKIGSIPESQLQDALKQGYTPAE